MEFEKETARSWEIQKFKKEGDDLKLLGNPTRRTIMIPGFLVCSSKLFLIYRDTKSSIADRLVLILRDDVRVLKEMDWAGK